MSDRKLSVLAIGMPPKTCESLRQSLLDIDSLEIDLRVWEGEGASAGWDEARPDVVCLVDDDGDSAALDRLGRLQADGLAQPVIALARDANVNVPFGQIMIAGPKHGA